MWLELEENILSRLLRIRLTLTCGTLAEGILMTPSNESPKQAESSETLYRDIVQNIQIGLILQRDKDLGHAVCECMYPD